MSNRIGDIDVVTVLSEAPPVAETTALPPLPVKCDNANLFIVFIVGPQYAYPYLHCIPLTVIGNVFVLNDIVSAWFNVKSLVFELKCSVVESVKSGSTPNSGVPLNVVPSSTVPNLLPKIVENKVLITRSAPGSKVYPLLTPVKLLIWLFTWLAISTWPVK